jgi:uncharacterized membrane protein YqiK
MDNLIFYAPIVFVAAGIFIAIATLIIRCYRQVDQGRVLIINKLGNETVVTFTGGVVLPIIHRAEVMDISLKTVDIDRRGKEGLICADNIRADIKVAFFVRVNKTRDDVLKVAQSIGCARASDEGTLEKLFEAKFSEALKTVGKQLDFEDLYSKRQQFKDEIVKVIGQDLNGYMLEDVAIDFLEQTPMDLLDKANVLDSVGIRKITEITSLQNIETENLRQNERMAITKRKVEADEAVMALERQRAKAAEEQKREIATIQAREEALAEQVRQEEHAKAELARIKAEEEVYISEQNKLRQVEVAQKNRERVVGIETERVNKDRALEAVNREREVELMRIAKEKALEVEKKAIAEVVRGRISVEKTVAQEEESIKDLRVTAEAKRHKEATIINAEAEAQEKLVKDIKAAEVGAEVAKLEARQRLTLAEADLEAADKTSKAKVRLSEGIQAEAAAEGLAQARVREADAIAAEKQGMVNVRVREAEAQAIEKQGAAQASVVREQLLAQAAGEEQKGLAAARVKAAEAEVIQKRGLAEAEVIQRQGLAEATSTREKLFAEAAAIQEKLAAEARGLAQKAEAMRALDGVGKEHEEFRLRLAKDRDVELESIRVRKDVAQAQASVMAQAFSNAKIQIVGGDGAFFDRFIKAVSLGQSVDGAISNSDSLQTFLKGYLDGEQSLPADLKEILSKPGLTQDAQNLALAGLLSRVAQRPEAIAAAVKSAAEKVIDTK